MKRRAQAHEHYTREHKGAKTIAELSGRLAPPEESAVKAGRDRQSREDDSGIALDASKLKIPKGYVEDGQAKGGLFGLEPVILVIMILLATFIAVIAYLVYRMPAPVK